MPPLSWQLQKLHLGNQFFLPSFNGGSSERRSHGSRDGGYHFGEHYQASIYEAFSQVAFDSIITLVKRAEPGTPFTISKTTSATAILTAVSNSLITLDIAVFKLCELIEVETEEAVAAALVRRLECLKTASDIRAGGNPSGMHDRRESPLGITAPGRAFPTTTVLAQLDSENHSGSIFLNCIDYCTLHCEARSRIHPTEDPLL